MSAIEPESILKPQQDTLEQQNRPDSESGKISSCQAKPANDTKALQGDRPAAGGRTRPIGLDAAVQAALLSGRKSTRPMQRGHLRVVGKSWVGYWNVKDGGRWVKRSQAIGRVCFMDEAHAQELLKAKISALALQADVGGRSGSLKTRWDGINSGLALRPPVQGAIYEHLVAADLMAKGYEVFTAACPTASCDMVCIINGQLSRVQVRSGRRKGNRLACVTKGEKGRFDLLAIVTPDWAIKYLTAADTCNSVTWCLVDEPEAGEEDAQIA